MPLNVRLSGAQTSPREESDLRFNYRDLRQIIAASTKLGGTQPMHFSKDGGHTWSQSSLPPFGAPDVRQGDPTIDWTSDGTAWSITIGISASLQLALRCFKSTDAGATWTFDSTLPGGQTAMDKEALWVDHHHSSPHRDNMYVIWHNGAPCFVAVRNGPGGTWSAPLQISGAETTGTAIGSDIKTNADGDVFAFWPDTGSQRLFVAKSTDGGGSFGTPVEIAPTSGSFQVFLPAQDNRGVLIYLSGGAYRTTTKDHVYAVWTDLAGGAGCNAAGDSPGSSVTAACTSRIWFSRSLDGGATWEAPKQIHDQSTKSDQFFARMAVDESNGNLMVVYYETGVGASRLTADLWMQHSTDDGVTWSRPTKVTNHDTNETVAGAQLNFQYGDYIGLTGHDGHFFACWTDRRSGGFEEIWGAPMYLRRDRDRYEEERFGLTGKISGITYDHFGDFDGFVLELFDGHEHRFFSHEHRVEEVVREAWEDRIVTTVIPEHEDHSRVEAIVLQR